MIYLTVEPDSSQKVLGRPLSLTCAPSVETELVFWFRVVRLKILGSQWQFSVIRAL